VNPSPEKENSLVHRPEISSKQIGLHSNLETLPIIQFPVNVGTISSQGNPAVD
jgi:hypothetical protein